MALIPVGNQVIAITHFSDRMRKPVLQFHGDIRLSANYISPTQTLSQEEF